uniref:Uncharacterized protein n=1 Tax=Leersia perrieri TaxID=77586 RepID=A0A0D9XJ06_9ORYZ
MPPKTMPPKSPSPQPMSLPHTSPLPVDATRRLIPRMITSHSNKTKSKYMDRFLFSIFHRAEERKESTTPDSSPQSILSAHSQLDFFTIADVPEDFENGKPFLPLSKLNGLSWQLRKFHEWYMTASHLGLAQLHIAEQTHQNIGFLDPIRICQA